MALGEGFAPPRLTNVPTTQRMIADDRLAVTRNEDRAAKMVDLDGGIHILVHTGDDLLRRWR